MIGWIVVWVLGVVAAAALYANRRWHWVAGWRYGRRARHVAVAAPEPEYRFVDMYGSMVLADEQDFLAERQVSYGVGVNAQFWPAPDWREQTAADLAPEALDSDVQPDPYLDAIAAEHGSEYDPEDSGPGASLVAAPGPDPIVLNMLAPPVEGPQWFNPIPAHVEPRDWSFLAAPTRLADTADVLDARLLADVAAELRAQDDDTALYLSRLRSACAQARLDLAAVLA